MILGKDCDITIELETLKKSLERQKTNEISLKVLKASYFISPLIISLGLMIFQQFSGINAVLFNLETIFNVSITKETRELFHNLRI